MNPGAPRSYDQVVVVSGHMIDRPDRDTPRFPASAEANVTLALRRQLEVWRVNSGTLLLSGGARGADIVAAELARNLGAEVWLLLPEPPGAFVASSVAIDGTAWTHRFERLRSHVTTLVQDDELGPLAPGENRYERNNRWLLETGRAHAPPNDLRIVVVWDNERADGPGGTQDFIERAITLDAEIALLDPGSSNT